MSEQLVDDGGHAVSECDVQLCRPQQQPVLVVGQVYGLQLC